MAHFHSNALIGAGGGAVEAGYQIDRSLRFNDGDSAHLTRSFQGGNQKKWTWSSWIKRAELGATGRILRANPSGEAGIQFLSNDRLEVYHYQNSSYVVQVVTDRVFRDPSAWFHLVVVYDSDQSTAADRLAIYINGVKETQFNTSTYPSQGYQSYLNGSTSHAIFGSDLFPAGYLAEVHFVDDQALAATAFGEEDSSGVWQPKEYSGTYAGKHNGDWVGDTTGNAYNSSHTADKAFDGSTSTSAAAGASGTLTFTPSTAITGITKVRIHAQRDNSASSATITLNGTDISSNWSNGEDKTVEITTNNLTSLAWTTQSNAQWFAVRKIEIYYSGAYYTLSGPSNSFYLKFADNSSNAALGTDSSGLSNTWTVNNLVAASSAVNVVGDPTVSNSDVPFVGGYSIAFDGNDALRVQGPGTVSGDFTMECFIKSSSYSGIQRFFTAEEGVNGSEYTNIRCYNGNTEFYFTSGVYASGTNIPTNQWNHVAMTRSGSTVSYYLNGSRWATDSSSASVQITTLVLAWGYGSEYFTGSISNARFVNGQALYTGTSYTVPTSTLTTTSQGATASNVTTLCCHKSTVTGFEGTKNEIVGGADIDSLIDTPTNYTADSGNNGGNYATLNPLKTGLTLSNGNLTFTGVHDSWRTTPATIGITSGKFYWEYTAANGANQYVGIGTSQAETTVHAGQNGNSWSYYTGGIKYHSFSTSSYGSTWGNGDIIGVALDADNGTLTFYKNGSTQGTAYTGLTSGPYFPVVSTNGTSMTGHVNFGQRPFAISSIPTGFKSLCTENLADPTIADGSTAMDVVTYSGNGANDRAITGINHSPDFVWIKARNQSDGHNLFDIVRGTTKVIKSNNTNAELTESNSLTAFNSDGFTVGNNSSNSQVNASGFTYVGWTWDGGSSNTSISAGSSNSAVYNESYDISPNTTSTITFGSNQALDKMFNGNTGDKMEPASSGSLDFTSVSGLQNFSGTLKFAVTAYNPNSSLKFVINASTDNLTFTADTFPPSGSFPSTLLTIPVTSLRTLDFTSISGRSVQFWGVYLDGKLLVDSSQTPPNVPSIASTVRANPSTGFSIVSWTGNGTSGSTVGHGLNAAPKMVIFKNRDTASTNWRVYNTMADGSLDWLYLNTTAAKSDSGLSLPTSNVFTAGGSNDTNGNGDAMINYCFTPVAGYSAFGSYTGNGSNDGPFIYTGFRPKFILRKQTNSAQHWHIVDTERDPENVTDSWLFPNLADAEGSGDSDRNTDILSNGFKIRSAYTYHNQSGSTYIYAAFAEHPFKTARAR